MLATGFVTLCISSISFAESDYLPSYVEQGLIQVCKAAAYDKTYKMNKEIKGLRIKTKVIALNVMCNGQDIISFAERYGAVKTTARLSKSIGSVQVTDLAAINSYNYDVTFEMN